MVSSSLYRLVDEKMRARYPSIIDLKTYIVNVRGNGVSYENIAAQLKRYTDVDVSSRTVRRWAQPE